MLFELECVHRSPGDPVRMRMLIPRSAWGGDRVSHQPPAAVVLPIWAHTLRISKSEWSSREEVLPGHSNNTRMAIKKKR